MTESSEVENANGKSTLPDDPFNIPLERVKAFAMANRLQPMEAFCQLLSQDLLDRLDRSAADDQMKAVARVLVSTVLGDGVVKSTGSSIIKG